jgi:predicted RNase H-like nuclease
MYLGLDGFRHGWVAVSIAGDDREIEFLRDIGQLSQRDYKMAMIDIPIGLPERGNRDCDMAARHLLDLNCNRVFTGARRPLLQHIESHQDANRRGRELMVNGAPGAGVSMQLFCILKKIKEADNFVDEALQDRVRETHPELIFWRLNDQKPVPNKHCPAGRTLRRKLLTKPKRFPDLERLLDERIGTGAKEDDVLDACACALAASACATGKGRVVPSGAGIRDDRNLKMQIWY